MRLLKSKWKNARLHGIINYKLFFLSTLEFLFVPEKSFPISESIAIDLVFF